MQYKCPTCGYIRGSYHDSPKCNHDQDEDGVPLPVALMLPMSPDDDHRTKILTDEQVKALRARRQ